MLGIQLNIFNKKKKITTTVHLMVQRDSNQDLNCQTQDPQVECFPKSE